MAESFSRLIYVCRHFLLMSFQYPGQSSHRRKVNPAEILSGGANNIVVHLVSLIYQFPKVSFAATVLNSSSSKRTLSLSRDRVLQAQVPFHSVRPVHFVQL